MSKVTQDAARLNLPEEKLLGDWIVCIPGFTLKKYRQLQRSRLSIFAMNCFGGLISHTLGLPFRSPFVNMWLWEHQYLRFLSSPRAHMKKELAVKEMIWNDYFKYNHPIALLGDVEIVMNHDPDFDIGKSKWDKRKAQINWYNLFVTMYTENEETLAQFDVLPYSKKVCFVPFKSDLDSAWYINPQIDLNLELNKKRDLWEIVNRFADSYFFYYDPFDMLLYGKKTPLIEM